MTTERESKPPHELAGARCGHIHRGGGSGDGWVCRASNIRRDRRYDQQPDPPKRRHGARDRSIRRWLMRVRWRIYRSGWEQWHHYAQHAAAGEDVDISDFGFNPYYAPPSLLHQMNEDDGQAQPTYELAIAYLHGEMTMRGPDPYGWEPDEGRRLAEQRWDRLVAWELAPERTYDEVLDVLDAVLAANPSQ